MRKLSVILIVVGFCLMSLGILTSLYGFHVGSETLVSRAAIFFASGSLTNIAGFLIMICLSLMFFLKSNHNN